VFPVRYELIFQIQISLMKYLNNGLVQLTLLKWPSTVWRETLLFGFGQNYTMLCEWGAKFPVLVGDNNSAIRSPTASHEECFKNPLLAISHLSVRLIFIHFRYCRLISFFQKLLALHKTKKLFFPLEILLKAEAFPAAAYASHCIPPAPKILHC